MRLDSKRVAASLSLLVLIGVVSAASASPKGSSTGGIVEINLTNTPLFSSGEPEIGVNPTNPNNMVFVSTYYRYIDIAGQRQAYNPLAPQGLLYGYTRCFLAWSMDRGRTWTPGHWPNGDRPYCGDPMVAVDRKGVFYIAMDWMGNSITPIVPTGNTQGVNGDIGVISSVDGGKSWYRYGTSNDEPVATGTEVDRPYFRVDSVTGKLYEESGLFSRTLAVSSNHGLTWSEPVPFPGNHIAVYRGILTTAAQEGQSTAFGGFIAAPSSGSSQLTLHISTNDGQSFQSYPVKDGKGRPVTGGTGDWISADPTRAGRFAVMQVDATGNFYEIYVAQVTGRSVRFSGPARIRSPRGAPSGLVKPWMDFGSTGVLGVMWKTADSAPFNVYSVVSFDHGATFSAPLKVNRKTSPAEDANRGDGGDDLSWIVLDNRYGYFGWGGVDPRQDALNGYFARVPLSNYTHQ